MDSEVEVWQNAIEYWDKQLVFAETALEYAKAQRERYIGKLVLAQGKDA